MKKDVKYSIKIIDDSIWQVEARIEVLFIDDLVGYSELQKSSNQELTLELKKQAFDDLQVKIVKTQNAISNFLESGFNFKIN